MRAVRAVIAPLLLAALVVTTLGGAARGGFVWDDRPLIVENPKVREAERVPELLTSSFWNTGDRHDRFRRFFRPLTSLSYAADHAAWGLDPFGFHVTNLLLHLGCCLLVVALARRDALPLQAALAGGALFALHPVHVESVAWISGRTDVLATLFALGAWLLACTGSERRAGAWRIASACGLFALSVLAKEMTATLPALIVLDRLGRSGEEFAARLRDGAMRALPFVITLAAVLVYRRAALGSGPAPLPALDAGAFVATSAWVLARYIVLLLIPRGLDAHYPDQPLDSPASLAFVSAMLVLAVSAWILLVLAHRDRRSAFWLAWIFVGLGPVLLFGTFGDVLLADRFLYFPSVGLALLAARATAALPGLVRGRPLRAGAALAGIGVLAAFGAVAHARVAVWHDDLTLFRAMARTSPDSGLVRNNLGLALYHEGEVQDAEREFRRAVELVPTYALAHNNLAAALERRGDARGALAHYSEALRLAPALIESRINVARLRVQTGQIERGLAELEELAAAHPTTVPVLSAFASALASAGRGGAALAMARRALRIDPSHAPAHYVAGSVHHAAGRREDARRSMERFVALWEADDVYRRAALDVIAYSRADSAVEDPAGSP